MALQQLNEVAVLGHHDDACLFGGGENLQVLRITQSQFANSVASRSNRIRIHAAMTGEI